MNIDLNDIRDTDVRMLDSNTFRLTNGAIGLDCVLSKKELREVLANIAEFVYELAYNAKDK